MITWSRRALDHTARACYPVQVINAAPRIAAAIGAIFWGFLFFGLIDLLAFLQGDEFHATLLLSTGWGLLFLFLVAAPLVVVAAAPAYAGVSALAEVVAVALALAVAAALSGSPRHLLATAGLLMTAGLVAAFASKPRPHMQLDWRPSWPALAVVVAGAGPLAYYAWTAARTTGTSTITDDSVGLDHWPVQSAVAIAAVLIALLAAGHPSGWRVPMWTVAASVAWFGVVALAEPDLVGSVNRGWAAAMLVWAVAFVGATSLGARLRSSA
jgi:hypothetical protein